MVLLLQSDDPGLAGVQVGCRLAGGFALPHGMIKDTFLEAIDQFVQVQPGILFYGRPAVPFLGLATWGQDIIQHHFVVYHHPLFENDF